MKIKSIKNFRWWYKSFVKERKTDNNTDENFIGTYFRSNGQATKKGFFEMFHGDKPDIAGYLPSILKIAEDGQAIYEFLQNAVDCNSSHFYIFYNDHYFLAINNGEPFDLTGLQSILNIAQSPKKNSDKIGRFGIGFKLVHRLVGKNEGVEELVNEYKGPVLFSWSRPNSIFDFILGENIQPIYHSKENPKEYLNAPWLLKILVTNFPAEPNETIKDIKYKDRVVFEQSELDDMVGFLKKSFEIHPDLQNPEKLKNILRQGSMFFLRLGEGKREMLDRDYENLKKGVEYSMNTLKRLEKVYINEEEIEKQPLELFEFAISKDTSEFSEIAEAGLEYKECDIKVAFGYYSDYKQSHKLKVSPNFYKYFPMGDENNGFSFIIHCDSFSNESNRRKLQADAVNKKLFPVIAQRVIERLDTLKQIDRNAFLRFYANLLLSDIPDKQNNDWLKPIFFDTLLSYLQANIPTFNGIVANNTYVKIKKTNFDFDFQKIGITNIDWFIWYKDEDKELISESQKVSKLHLETWDSSDIILNCNAVSFNSWIATLEKPIEEQFWVETRTISNTKWTKQNQIAFIKFTKLKLLSFTDNTFKSIEEAKILPKSIILNEGLLTIADILVKSKLNVSLRYFTKGESASPLSILVHQSISYLNNDILLFNKIIENADFSLLEPNEKIKLITFFENLEGIGKAHIQNLNLFQNTEGVIKPLKELLPFNQKTPLWLYNYKVKSEEYSEPLKKYLLQEKEIYKTLILPNWALIIVSISDVVDFYAKVKYYFDLEEGNTPLSKQAFIHTKEGFKVSNEVFYNPKVTQIQNYQHIQSALSNLLDCPTPTKNILSYLKDVPFKADIWDFADWELVQGVELSLDETKAILSFTSLNNEFFFERCLIERNEEGYLITEKTKDSYQFHANKTTIVNFIKINLSSNFKQLPSELSGFRDEKGILQKEDLHIQLLEEVDVDDFLEELIDIVEYSAKHKIFAKINTITFNGSEKYERNDIQYKILDLACRELQKNPNQQEAFRKKIRIETSDATLELSEIQPSNDDVVFENGKYKLSLAQILPNSFQNSDFLTNIIRHFSELGIQRQQLETLFGISKELDFSHIIKLVLDETKGKLQNTQQLLFIVLYHNLIGDKNYNDEGIFKIEDFLGNWQYLYTHYIHNFSFISNTVILHKKYSDLKHLLSINENNPIFPNGDEELILEPYFSENSLVIPYFGTIGNLSDIEKKSFIDFLFNQWGKKNKKTIIKKIDWSKINEIETLKILGFNPNYSVYPNEYALQEEKLPKYLTDWIEVNETDNKLKFLYDFGVSISASLTVKLRKYLQSGGVFTKSQINKEGKEDLIFNTFEWLKSNQIEITSDEAYKVFVEMVDFVNEERKEGGDLIIETKFDFTKLSIDSFEWNEAFYKSWKEKIENKYSIYLYSGKLPKIISLDEISDYVFREYNEDDIAVNETLIYVNSHKDIEKLLYTLVIQELMTSEDLLELYQTKKEVSSSSEVEVLKNEVSRLRGIIENLTKVSGTASYSPTVSHDDYHDEIKEKSEKFLNLHLQKEYQNNVVWLNSNEDGSFFESWENHDFQILDDQGNILNYIDCKGTPANKKTIYLTQNEWDFFLSNTDNYQIYRIFNIDATPRVLKIDNLLDWLLDGRIVPYLLKTEEIKGGRVFLTITN